MNQLVLRSYFSKSFSRRGVPTSPAHTPRWMSYGESAPPYEPIQPATASMSIPIVAKISFGIRTFRQLWPPPGWTPFARTRHALPLIEMEFLYTPSGRRRGPCWWSWSGCAGRWGVRRGISPRATADNSQSSTMARRAARPASSVLWSSVQLACLSIVLGIGTRPNAGVAAAADVPLGETGAIKVNGRMQTEVEGVWAAGDCAEAFHLVRRRPVNIALGTIADKQGRICRIDVGGGYATFPGVVGTAVSKICALEVACTEMNKREAAEMGCNMWLARSRAQHAPATSPERGSRPSRCWPSGAVAACWVPRSWASRARPNGSTSLPRLLRTHHRSGLHVHRPEVCTPVCPSWVPIMIAARKATAQL
jgi:hypothetical protein